MEDLSFFRCWDLWHWNRVYQLRLWPSQVSPLACAWTRLSYNEDGLEHLRLKGILFPKDVHRRSLFFFYHQWQLQLHSHFTLTCSHTKKITRREIMFLGKTLISWSFLLFRVSMINNMSHIMGHIRKQTHNINSYLIAPLEVYSTRSFHTFELEQVRIHWTVS